MKTIVTIYPDAEQGFASENKGDCYEFALYRNQLFGGRHGENSELRDVYSVRVNGKSGLLEYVPYKDDYGPPVSIGRLEEFVREIAK